MYALHGERMLQAWERGQERAEPWRGLALLELAMPERDIESLGMLPLAERNALLLELRSLTFGPQLEGFAVCPECGAQLEFVLNAGDVEASLHAPGEEAWMEHDTEMCMRPVNARDLAAAMSAHDSAGARAVLLERTVSPRPPRGLEAATEAEESGDWLERFERLNASAEIRCVLPCSGCGEQAVLDLDIDRFLWREVTVAARRLLAEIHRLARAYGWSEQAIVAMSAARRATYLEMLDA
jgi:hypothetical protein